MKYLKKFNENKIEIDEDYLLECFIDLIDAGATYGFDSDEYGDWFCITIEPTGLIETDNEIMQDIQYGIEKVRIKYPDVQIETVADYEEIDVYVKLHNAVN